MSTAQYRRGIRAAIRGLWSGILTRDDFDDAMRVTIRRNLTLGWERGAKECGILPDELSEAERAQLQARIEYEYQWIDGFADTIIAQSKENGGKLRPLYNRAEVWIGRYEGIKTEARVMACADRKLRWTLGPTEHCRSCTKLAGKVKRASYWNEKGILPRIHDAWYLECGGWRCQCQLLPTDEPMSKGPLPKLP